MYFTQDATYLSPMPGKNPASVTSHVGFNENATLPFEPGKTYRLRIVNVGAFTAFYFWIDGHEMRIIEADGVSIAFRSTLEANIMPTTYHRPTSRSHLSTF